MDVDEGVNEGSVNLKGGIVERSPACIFRVVLIQTTVGHTPHYGELLHTARLLVIDFLYSLEVLDSAEFLSSLEFLNREMGMF